MKSANIYVGFAYIVGIISKLILCVQQLSPVIWNIFFIVDASLFAVSTQYIKLLYYWFH